MTTPRSYRPEELQAMAADLENYPDPRLSRVAAMLRSAALPQHDREAPRGAVEDGSDKPIGHQTDDGELEVREVDGERIYHETELGQHMRWMRQAPDLFTLYQEAKVYESHLRLVMIVERDKLTGDRDIWKRAWAALFQTLKATHGTSAVIDRACHSFHGDENCLLAGPHEGVPHVSINGAQWTE